MIIKSFELKKKVKDQHFFLIYGNNQGLINEIINQDLKNLFPQDIFRYEEVDILKDSKNFKRNIFNKSFFETKKTIIVNRVTDKFLTIIEEILTEGSEDIYLICIGGKLDNKSKIRKYFEKEKIMVCTPVYEDNSQTLSQIVQKFMKIRNINISQHLINIIVSRASGDRIFLHKELEKIDSYTQKTKKINLEEILKITNLSENFTITELIDNCLAKNNVKIIKILNENNFSNEDSILIMRTLLNKSKKILKLLEEFKINKNIELVIASAKPPIFWKDKEITKQQIYKWSPNKIKNLMYELNNLELFSKKNFDNSLKLVTDFIIEALFTILNYFHENACRESKCFVLKYGFGDLLEKELVRETMYVYYCMCLWLTFIVECIVFWFFFS